jgi:hypothetical protein
MINLKETLLHLRIAVIIFLFTVLSNVHANQFVYHTRPSKDFIKIPQEFNYLLQSLNQLQLTPSEEKKLYTSLGVINRNIERLDRQYLLFMLQIEIYQGAAGSVEKVDELPPTPFNLARLARQRKLVEASSSIFGLWLFDAIYKDLEEMDARPQYHQLFKTEYSITLPEVRKMVRSIKMLSPWYTLLLQPSMNRYDYFVKKVILKVVSKLAEHTSHLADLSGFFPTRKVGDQNPANGLIAVTKNKSGSGNQSPLDSLLDSGSTLLTIPDNANKADEWSPQDDNTTQRASLQIEPDPNYVAPDTLPIPIDDWGEDAE